MLCTCMSEPETPSKQLQVHQINTGHCPHLRVEHAQRRGQALRFLLCVPQPGGAA